MVDIESKYPTFEGFEAAVKALFPNHDWNWKSPFSVEWTTGGVAGGNCWNSGGHYSVEAEEEPEDENLDKVLEEVCPNLTFLQFRKLQRAGLYSFEEGTHREYYGNYTEYKKRELNLNALYEALKEL